MRTLKQKMYMRTYNRLAFEGNYNYNFTVKKIMPNIHAKINRRATLVEIGAANF